MRCDRFYYWRVRDWRRAIFHGRTYAFTTLIAAYTCLYRWRRSHENDCGIVDFEGGWALLALIDALIYLIVGSTFVTRDFMTDPERKRRIYLFGDNSVVAPQL
jgi:hypothetical protein